MNVSELIRKLKMNREEFFGLAKDLGFGIGERAIKIDDRVANKLTEAIKQHFKQSAKRSLFADESTATADTQDVTDNKDEQKIVLIPEKITVKNFADRLHKQVTDLIAILLKNGMMATINENLDFETASIIAEDLGFKPEKETDVTEEKHAEKETKKIAEILKLESQQKSTLKERPPVIVVMGHVDHGKTKLLDAIRHTNVVDEEAGGITQSIGAYQVEHNGRLITFIDTPGHEAFTAMRSRGANVADLAILVVAADDGVKPQTVEAIEIMEKAQLPYVVAINKIDKETADVEKVKKNLSDLNLIPEEWGGKTICVPISAKQHLHIDELLDMLLLLADMNKEKIMANPNRDAVGTIIESKIDKDSGPIATVLVQTGTLKIGDLVIVGQVSGKIKALKNWKGNQQDKALPATPVRFLGLKGAPVVGDVLQVTTDKKALKTKQKQYQSFGFLQAQKPTEDTEETKQLKVVLKADTLGSLEAIISSLEKIQHKEVSISIVNKGLGNITEKDIDQAEAGKAVIVGFNVSLTPTGQDHAHGTTIVIKTYKIIYELIDFIKEQLEALLPPEIIYEKVGVLKVLAIFKSANKYTILGGRVEEGIIKDKAIVKIFRSEKQIGEGTISQLQSEKKNVSEIKAKGTECGIQLSSEATLAQNDILEIYEKREIKKKLF
ncbi:MAG: translation initiation factor IF-2 [Patescibacteria group bacterium]